ncbi:hypothetical protein BV898_03487 [Hypsibius exemplaris]|uniref:WAP domain-containing protein n=1 Tax=Hypsibius exemplaris TaxID=2072580 RepID=A0A1W0X5R6_HYPEX|nr:hypothetical protein BV898_03487 [Hypsibius exemplaris]
MRLTPTTLILTVTVLFVWSDAPGARCQDNSVFEYLTQGNRIVSTDGSNIYNVESRAVCSKPLGSPCDKSSECCPDPETKVPHYCCNCIKICGCGRSNDIAVTGPVCPFDSARTI